MRCANCEREFDETVGDCPYCGAVPEQNIRRTHQNVNSEQGGYWQEINREDTARRKGARIHMRRINFSYGLIPQLIFIIIVLIIVLFAIFILLPASVLLFLGLVVAWFIFRLFKAF